MRSFVLLLVALSLNAASFQANGNPLPNPTPSPGKATEKDKAFSQSKDQNATTNQKPSPQAATAIDLTKTKEKSSQSNGDSNKSSQPSSPDWIMGFTGVLALTAVMQIVLFCLQLRWMRQGAATSVIAAQGAKDSAEAAKATVKSMNDTAQKELRAYMGVERISLRDSRPRWEIVIKNFGNTMAKDAEICIMAEVRTVPCDTFQLGERRCKTVVMPKETLMFNEKVKFEKHDRELLEQGAAELFIWGRINYRDVFGEQRWTTFRFVNDGSWTSTAGEGGHFNQVWQVKTCVEGNDAN
jgi:hypothetical protein